MRRRLLAVGSDAGNLCLKLRDARIKLCQRIAIKAFAREKACGIATRSRSIIVVHCSAASDGLRLLSTASKFTPCPKVFLA